MNTGHKYDNGVLPDGWEMVRLGDVAALRNTQVTPSKTDTRPYIALEHIEAGGSLIDQAEARHAISNKTEFRSGDTLYGKLRPNLRKVVRIKFDGVCSTDILAIHGKENVDRHFLSHMVRSDLLHEHAMRGIAGTKMPRTSWGHLQKYRFACPPLPEQRAIADVLDSIDEAIERTEAVIAATETLRDSLLHELLTRGVPGWHTEWKDVPGIGTIPADWEVVRLRDILVIDQPGAWGSDPTPESPGVSVLRAADLTRDGRVDASTAAKRCLSERDLKRRLFSDGDIILERSGGGPGTPVGRIALVSGLGTIYCNNFCQQLRVDDVRCNPVYAVKALWHRYLRGVTARLEHQTTGIRNLDYDGYLSHPIPLPQINEQQAIIDVLSGMESRLEATRAELVALTKARSTFSDALLTGRSRVGMTRPQS